MKFVVVVVVVVVVNVLVRNRLKTLFKNIVEDRFKKKS